MSWDIFVQDIPVEVQSVSDIPEDFRPAPIASRTHVLEAIQAAAPFADFADPTWIHIDAPEVCIEVSVPQDEPLMRFAFHIHGGEHSAAIVADVLGRLDVRAFDTASETGIFDLSRASESLHRWHEYRTRVLPSPNV